MSDANPTRWTAPAAVALFSGFVFAIGLGLAGMTNPAKVIAFLDVAGDWDPSLALVMGAAIAVYFPVVRALSRKEAPRLDARFHWPTKLHVDRPLLIGAALFGVGWGLAGYCPGPAIVASTTATVPVLALFGAMLVGMIGQNLLIQRGLASRVLRRD